MPAAALSSSPRAAQLGHLAGLAAQSKLVSRQFFRSRVFRLKFAPVFVDSNKSGELVKCINHRAPITLVATGLKQLLVQCIPVEPGARGARHPWTRRGPLTPTAGQFCTRAF